MADELKDIYQRLGSIEMTVARIDTKTEIVARHEQVLHGDYRQPGLMGRMDRIEQIEINRKWQIRTIWTALIGVFASWLAALAAWFMGGGR